MSINRQNLTSFRKDFKKAVADLEKQYGLELSLGTISFTEETFRTKLEAVTVATGEDYKSKEKINFEAFCSRYGFAKGDHGRSFIVNGRRYFLNTIKTKNPKYPIIALNSEGKSYKFNKSQINLK